MAPSRRAGFVLPAVLMLTGMVSLIFLVAIAALDTLGTQTRRVVEDVRFRQEALTIEARAGFWAATSAMDPTAIAPRPGRVGPPGAGRPPSIGLDGRYYSVAPTRVLASFQDEGGLINLDLVGADGLRRLFAILGLPPRTQQVMADRLEDYVDPDDLKRPDGAEREDYLRAGLAEPPNAPLTRQQQLFGVLGWHDAVAPEVWRGMRDLITADPTAAAVNVNTASAPVLQVLFGLSSEQAAAAVRARQAASFTSLEDLGRAVGIGLHSDAERVYTFPNGRIALRIVDRVTGEIARARVVLTPDDAEQPVWSEDKSFAYLTRVEQEALPANAPALPDPTS